MDLKTSYQQQVDKYASEVATLRRKNNGFITGELLSFGAILTFVVCYIAMDEGSSRWLLGAVLALIAYFNIRRLDDKNKEKIAHLSALLAVYQNLSLQTPLKAEEIARRVALQKELAGDEQQGELWRMEFLALGERNKKQVLDAPDPDNSHRLYVDMAAEPVRRVVGYRKIDSSAVAEAIRKVSAMAVPAWYGSKASLLLGWAFIIGVCSSVLLSVFGVVSVNVPLWWVMIQYMVVFFVCKQTLDKIDSHGGKLRDQLVAYSQILQLVARRHFRSELGQQMQSTLSEALPSFVQLEKILKGYDRRGNFLGLFFTDAFMLSDFFLVRSFLKWKNTYVVKMEEWMDIVSELDAAVSMADFRYNHPEATDAEIVDGSPVLFEAKNLYHPFLGAKAVKNDFTIRDDNYYIITGANMAGKSTFLRSLGVNYILAMSGMPVFAGSLKVSRFQLFSSMRTTDDLTHGISYFNAELLRLEQLMQFCKRGELRTLIILDEILKGTNSLDKLNGSRLFLEVISRMPVTGVIATHDLELSRMAESCPGRFHNYCFEIDLGTDVTYTYKIQPGVARNQNATFLLNKILERN